MSFVIDHLIGYRINRCTVLLRAALTRHFKAMGQDLTPEEWIILNRLWEKDGRSQNELAESTLKDKTTVARFLDRMERKGLVIRRNASEDARVNEIYLTPTAQALRDLLIPHALELLDQCIAGVDAQELATTLAVLRKIEQNLLDAT